MSTTIAWTDETVNFWSGCAKISEGCEFCYIYRIHNNDKRSRTPIKNNSYYTSAKKLKGSKRIFTCSMADFFIGNEETDKDVETWRKQAWDVIKNTPQHTWMILTKRPQNILKYLPPDWDNGWLGISTENQKRFDPRCINFFKSISSTLFYYNTKPELQHELEILHA